MIELPESITIASQFNQLAGKNISRVILQQTPHRFAFINPKIGFEPLVCGQIIQKGYHVGGFACLETEDCIIAFSDGAYPRYYSDAKSFPKTSQLFMEFCEGGAIASSVQMYGFFYAFSKDDCNDNYFLRSKNRPNALSGDFTMDYFKQLFASCCGKLSVKAFLATEQRIPGLGNGVLQDVLWQAELNPKCKLYKLSDYDVETLYNSLVDLNKQMAMAGGRITEKDLFGNKGKYNTLMCASNVAMPCIRCGAPIQKAAYMGGNVYYCPQCQKQ